MILGTGVDMVDQRRMEVLLEQFGERLKKRIFCESEWARAMNKPTREAAAGSLAKTFAAKEAFVKALGSGFRNGLYLKHIEVWRDDAGRPHIRPQEKAAHVLGHMKPGHTPQIHLSITDQFPYALAWVIIETL